MTKRCGRCGEEKPIEAFHRSARRGHQYWCKACRRVYDSAYSKATLERRRERYHEQRPDFVAWYQGLMENKPCADCGATFHPAAMQWDHLPGTDKAANVADYAHRGREKRLLEEIEKCELVCANCHAIRTFVRRHGA